MDCNDFDIRTLKHQTIWNRSKYQEEINFKWYFLKLYSEWLALQAELDKHKPFTQITIKIMDADNTIEAKNAENYEPSICI